MKTNPKQVSWNPNTYFQRKNRDIYKQEVDKKKSWVNDMKDFVPSLSFNENELCLYSDGDHCLQENVKKHLSYTGINEDISEHTALQRIRLNMNDIRSKLQILKSTSMSGEESQSNSSILRRNSNVSTKLVVREMISKKQPPPVKKRPLKLSASQTDLITTSNVSTTSGLSKNTNLYNPPRWSQILKEELRYRADMKDTSLKEMFPEQSTGNVEDYERSKFDHEISAVFNNTSNDEFGDISSTSSTPVFIPKSNSSSYLLHDGRANPNLLNVDWFQ